MSDKVRKEANAKIATEHKLEFSWSGPTYGMGGYFDGNDVGETDHYGEESDGWNASSQSC